MADQRTIDATLDLDQTSFSGDIAEPYDGSPRVCSGSDCSFSSFDYDGKEKISGRLAHGTRSQNCVLYRDPRRINKFPMLKASKRSIMANSSYSSLAPLPSKLSASMDKGLQQCESFCRLEWALSVSTILSGTFMQKAIGPFEPSVMNDVRNKDCKWLY